MSAQHGISGSRSISRNFSIAGGSTASGGCVAASRKTLETCSFPKSGGGRSDSWGLRLAFVRQVLSALLPFVLVAQAEASERWELITESQRASFLIHVQSIKLQGQRARFWQLINFKQRDAQGAMSSRSLWEADCREGRARLLQFSLWSQKDGSGKLVQEASNLPVEWRFVEPGTPLESFVTVGCYEDPKMLLEVMRLNRACPNFCV